MPGFTPARRWQPPYHPFKREPYGTRVLESVERVIKGTAVRMPDVWELFATGDCIYLPYGMSQR